MLTITLSGKAVRMRIELIESDRQSEMLAVTPTNLMWTVRESNPSKNIANVFRPALEHDSPKCIVDRIRTCNHFIPGEVSGQSECYYIFLQRTFRKVSLLHLTGITYFLLSASNSISGYLLPGGELYHSHPA